MSEKTSGREHLDPRLLTLMDNAEKMQWLFMKDLSAGDILEVRTLDKLCVMRVLNSEDEGLLITSNGKYATNEKRGFVVGSSLTGTGTMVKVGGIAIGLRLVLFVEGIGELLLSATQEVRVNGVTVLRQSIKQH